MKNFITLIVVALTLTACFDEEDKISTPSATYPETNLDATFYSKGNAGAPTVEWNGNQGTFSLDTEIEGLTVNSTTGQISWTKLLPPGTHDFQVIASNSAGQIGIPFIITNPFQGYFEGSYSGSTYFAVNFSEDGSVTVEANSITNPDRASGTYTLNGDEVIANYLYEGTSSPYSIKVTLAQTNSNAVLTGSFYLEADAPADRKGGDVSLILQ